LFVVVIVIVIGIIISISICKQNYITATFANKNLLFFYLKWPRLSLVVIQPTQLELFVLLLSLPEEFILRRRNKGIDPFNYEGIYSFIPEKGKTKFAFLTW
jgi:hypothetical protein